MDEMNFQKMVDVRGSTLKLSEESYHMLEYREITDREGGRVQKISTGESLLCHIRKHDS